MIRRAGRMRGALGAATALTFVIALTAVAGPVWDEANAC